LVLCPSPDIPMLQTALQNRNPGIGFALHSDDLPHIIGQDSDALQLRFLFVCADYAQVVELSVASGLLVCPGFHGFFSG
jgi:hypothetical protein